MPSRVVTAILAVLAIAHVRAGADWPQFLGPDAQRVVPRRADRHARFPPAGRSVVWSRKLGQGLSGPVVVGTQVIVFHRVGDREVVESLDAASGKTRWQYGYPTAYRDDFGFDEGPRAVPVVADGVVYTFGAEGQLQALSLERGEPLWSEQTARQFGVPKGFFGAAGSPLVEGGRRDRECRRLEGGHHRLQRTQRRRRVDRHRRCRQLLVSRAAPRSPASAMRFS